MLGWTLVRTEALQKLTASALDNGQRVLESAGELSRCHETIAQQRQRIEELEERVEFAETTITAQNQTVANLWSGNDRLLGMVSDMRRLGFEMPTPRDTSPPDNIGSVDDDDRDAVKADPKLAASYD